MIAITACMENLQGNFASFLVYRIGHLAVITYIEAAVEQPGKWIEPRFFVGVKTARHDQANPPAGPLGKIGRQLGELPKTVFKTRMHRPHDHPILDLGMPQIQRGKQIGIAVGCHGVVSKGICTTDGYALINLDSVKLRRYFDSVKMARETIHLTQPTSISMPSA